MSSKTDLRVIKTKKAIYSAFIELMETKGLTAMTVQDILDKALINRKTFYTYYHDKYDLAEQVGTEFLTKFDEILSKRFPLGASGKYSILSIDDIYEDLYREKKDILVIWNIRTDRINVYDEVSSRLEEIYKRISVSYNAPGDIVLQSYMFSNFVMTSYKYIMSADKKYETHQLLKEYKYLCDLVEKAASPKSM